ILRRNSTPILADSCGLHPSQIYVFIRQSNSIGSDVPMELAARALVTISRHTPLDLFMQGKGRMRNLKGGQTLGVVCTGDDARVIQTRLKEAPGALTLAQILKYQTIVQG